MREHIRRPDGSELSVPATATICSRQPSLTATIAPGQEFQQWAIFHNVSLSDPVSLEWKAPGGGPPSGQTPYVQPFATGPDTRPGPTDVPDEPLPPAGTPPMPTGLTATPISPTVIRLQWTNNARNATSFEINNGDTSSYADATAPSLDWTGLAPGSSTCFRIRAFNATVASSWFPNVAPFNVCATTPAAAGAPSAPTGLVLKQTCGAGQPQVQLAWNANPEPGISAYVVEKAIDADWRTVSTAAARSYTDRGASSTGGRLVPRTVYYYRVRARDGGGTMSAGRATGILVRPCRGGQPRSGDTTPSFTCLSGRACATQQTVQTVLLASQPLDASGAAQRAKTALARRLGPIYTRGTRKRLTCRRQSTATYVCAPSWRYGTYGYRGTVRVNENGLVGIRVIRRRG
jgi:hypothetical protein